MNKLLTSFKSKTNDFYVENRVTMAPMTRVRATEYRNVTEEMTTYYQQRATAGLIITEGVIISPEGAGYIKTPGIYTERQINGWKKVTDAVHQEGGKIFAQIWHCGAVSHPTYHGGFPPKGPSKINPSTQTFTLDGFKDSVVAQEMTLEDINEVIRDFELAAIRAVDAGFDGVQIHGANGYLFDQFFRSGTNLRTDNYGGCLENRSRLFFEVLERVIAAVGSSRVAVRLSPAGQIQVLPDSNVIETYDFIVNKLNDYDIAFLELLEPKNFFANLMTESDNSKQICFDRPVCEHYRDIYDGTIMTNGGYTPESALEALEKESADLVSFGNLYISNPTLVGKIRAGITELESVNKDYLYVGEKQGYTDYV
ncbi:alkene reductase [Vibrio splendidus]|uniref:alkene reductase n=1 Tax=Vibrio splendidus TaxID=29497 RepID=UPI003D0BCE31